MPTIVWILIGIALGALSGCAALFWSRQLLKNRRRNVWISRPIQCVLIIAAAFCGGIIGFSVREWLMMAFILAMLTICVSVSVTDGLCRIIPNPVVLAIFVLKFLLIAGALLQLPATPAFNPISSLGGMISCFLIFSAPGLTGKHVGAGDIKLAAAMGFLLEFEGAMVAVAFMGLLVLGYCMVQRKMPLLLFLKTDIPMGPFIAAGMLLAVVAPCVMW